uniref:Uncharacterized protein n=1 Tax=Sipha flava TaxID=143950 RepID=A0A2S2Q533_9HEMI
MQVCVCVCTCVRLSAIFNKTLITFLRPPFRPRPWNFFESIYRRVPNYATTAATVIRHRLRLIYCYLFTILIVFVLFSKSDIYIYIITISSYHCRSKLTTCRCRRVNISPRQKFCDPYENLWYRANIVAYKY